MRPPPSSRRAASTVTVTVDEPSRVSSARRTARRLGEGLGFTEEASSHLALVVTEAATNLIRHATGGQIAFNAYREDDHVWLEILALDRGPGIRHLGRALAGGVSTGGGLGHGLGAIRRLADDFGIFAPWKRGTAVLARIGSLPAASPCPISGVSKALRGQRVCGDGWGLRHVEGDKTLLLVLDGVGHGPAAHEAVNRALAVLDHIRHPRAGWLLGDVHKALQGTRGAAGLAVLFDPRVGELTVAGVGNLHATSIQRGDRHGLVSLNGTLGVGSPTIQEFTDEWSLGAVLVAQTDGVSSHWSIDEHVGLWRQDPGLIAGVLFRDHAWPHDDATLVAVRRPDLDIEPEWEVP